MAYSFIRSITIDHTKCGSGNSSNFPVTFAGTYSYLKTVGDGGDVTNANGYDIIFSATTSSSGKLSFQKVKYDATTGAVHFKIKVPTISSSVDTVIYILYGDATVTTFQGNVTDTWSNGFGSVWLFGDGVTLDLNDATSNTNTLTNHNTATAAAGVIDGAVALASASSQYLTSANDPLSGLNSISLEIWGNPISNSVQQYALGKNSGGTHRTIILGYQSGFWNIFDGVYPTGTASDTQIAASTGVFNHIVYATNGSTLKGYKNGAQIISVGAGLSNVGDISTNWIIGAFTTGPANFFNGSEAEVKIHTVMRDVNWILTSYNNLNSPSTFYTVGSVIATGQLFRSFLELDGVGGAGSFAKLG